MSSEKPRDPGAPQSSDFVNGLVLALPVSPSVKWVLTTSDGARPALDVFGGGVAGLGMGVVVWGWPTVLQ